MYSQYGINSSSKIKLKNVVDLIYKALDREQEAKAWDRWVRLCPYMELGQIKFINFKDYKDALLKPKSMHTQKTSEEVLKEMMPVIIAHERK